MFASKPLLKVQQIMGVTCIFRFFFPMYTKDTKVMYNQGAHSAIVDALALGNVSLCKELAARYKEYESCAIGEYLY